MSNVEVNSHGTNKKITANILSDEKMREIGFTDRCKDCWYFCRYIEFPKEKKYRYLQNEITFNVTIPKDGSDIRIDIIEEDFGQPYDYQHILKNNKNNNVCLIVKEEVEKWMKYMQDNGVLNGHVYGEYI